MNPRAAINDLLPFQGSPFSHLGTSPSQANPINRYDLCNGEGGIRTHAPLRTNGFQDRLVMTTSIPLQSVACLFYLKSDNLSSVFHFYFLSHSLFFSAKRSISFLLSIVNIFLQIFQNNLCNRIFHRIN